MALALYRKYRPSTFAEVIGQEHVTDPLRTSLRAGRINHAYLFSGPRGCGKTSSARILARSLNCAQGPTDEPCGTCNSCVGLAPNGPGTVDVVELDAASHGGVDDARELRDKAFYAPAESRYRVFIIDEAHMVTTQGFNALLKIVEEPPEHLIFIFATTEPDKVLTTIRSRTHHYPFRLIPPKSMRELLERNCAAEGVEVEPPVFPLVIRAGGGSARDTQSVLDQLLAGAGAQGVTYAGAVNLLGVTDVALIDDLVDGLAAGDGGSVFGTVEQVVDAGHDPRRFASDLLDRFRDLVLLTAVPEAGERGLITAPADELTRMRDQADRLGQATVTRYAETVHTGLIEMRGATAPRLLLELLCSRMMLPSAQDTESAVLQRVERLERRLTAGGATAEPVAAQAASAAVAGAQNAGAQNAGAQNAGAQNAGAPTPAAADPSARGHDSLQAVAEPPVAEKPRFERPSQRTPSVQSPAAAAAPAPLPDPAPAVARRVVDSSTGDSSTGDSSTGDSSTGDSSTGDSSTGHRGSGGSTAPDPTPPWGIGEPVTSAAERDDAAQPEAGEHGESLADGADTVRAPERHQVDDTNPDSSIAGAPISAAPNPGELISDDPQPDETHAPGSLDAAAVRRVWSEVLTAIRASSRSVEAMMMQATVQSVENNAVTLTHAAPPLVNRLSEPRNIEIVATALTTALGGSWQVRWAAPGTNPGPTVDAPTKRAPKFEPTRRSQQDKPVARVDEPEPEPEPELPPPPPPEPVDEEDMLAEASRPLSDEERANQRTPEDAAIELLAEHLGATKIER